MYYRRKLEVAENELSLLSEKKESKVTPSEVEEVLSMWEEANHRLMTMISILKEELSNVHNEYDSLSKSVKHLSLRTHSLNDSRNQDGVPEIKDTKNFHSRRTIGSSKK